ncbi:hypothetical protein ACFW5W_13175 [Streptomyces sp. NPDC058783]|uniref:hypothetical protein n=1 Tax=Streptomyces TaxID=1883 RepID=UPI00210AAC93|nr:hypothetical protein [Streptomyces coelicoflavus]MCQ4202222.1 hypothetical protein [Streptomyces coelicoflavus]
MSDAQHDALRPVALASSAEARPRSGKDVSLGYYLERPLFLSLALVACSPKDGTALPCLMP